MNRPPNLPTNFSEVTDKDGSIHYRGPTSASGVIQAVVIPTNRGRTWRVQYEQLEYIDIYDADEALTMAREIESFVHHCNTDTVKITS